MLSEINSDIINTIIQGETIEEMKRIADGSVDMILADLPYGTTACKWDTVIPFEPLWAEYERIIKPNGAIVLTASQPFTSALVMSNPKLFRHEWVWRKSHGAFATAKIKPLKRHEDVLVFGKNRVRYYPIKEIVEGKVRDRRTEGFFKNNSANRSDSAVNPGTTLSYSKDYNPNYKNPISVIKFPNPPTNRVHPTQKPVELFEYLIRTYTNEGETVLDNVIGSGTTAVAAINTGRQFIGIEREEEYVNIARERVKKAYAERDKTGVMSND